MKSVNSYSYFDEKRVVVNSCSDTTINPLKIIFKALEKVSTFLVSVYLSIIRLVKFGLFLFHCFDLCVCRPRNIMVYNCTTGSTNPFHWGEVGMILLVFLNVRINLKERKILTEVLC